MANTPKRNYIKPRATPKARPRKVVDLTTLYFALPADNKKNKFHIFSKDTDESLCKTWVIAEKSKHEIDDVEGNESYVKSYDCKLCFEKAGLHIPEVYNY